MFWWMLADLAEEQSGTGLSAADRAELLALLEEG